MTTPQMKCSAYDGDHEPMRFDNVLDATLMMLPSRDGQSALRVSVCRRCGVLYGVVAPNGSEIMLGESTI